MSTSGNRWRDYMEDRYTSPSDPAYLDSESEEQWVQDEGALVSTDVELDPHGWRRFLRGLVGVVIVVSIVAGVLIARALLAVLQGKPVQQPWLAAGFIVGAVVLYLVYLRLALNRPRYPRPLQARAGKASNSKSPPRA